MRPCIAILSISIVTLTIVVQHNQPPSNDKLIPYQNYDTIAQSAINRTNSIGCKNQLVNFIKDSKSKQVNLSCLKRTCHRDDNTNPKFNLLGTHCPSINESIHLILINESRTKTRITCLETCFSYNLRYGIFNRIKKQCFCSTSYPKTTNNECDTDDLFEWYEIGIGIFKLNQNHDQHQTIDRPVSSETVRIAFVIILNGRSYIQYLRLIGSIYSRKHIYYLHIDKRDDFLYNKLLYLEDNYSNIIITRNRHATIWGGPALLDMIIESMRILLHHDLSWDYLVNLSGSDYPIKPIAELELYLSENLVNEPLYLKFHDLNGYDFIKKQALNQNFYQCDNRAWHVGFRELPLGVIYSGGSDWFALPRNFCSDMIANIEIPKTLQSRLLDIYKHSLLPVESYVHTIALNSEYCDKILNNNLKFTNWNRKKGCNCQHNDVVDWCGCSPSIFKLKDRNRLIKARNKTGIFFARKFDAQLSTSIINFLDQLIVESITKDGIQNDTRYWQPLWFKGLDLEPCAYRQLADYALRQAEAIDPDCCNKYLDSSKDVQEINAFFSNDTFIGWIIELESATMTKGIIQLLIEPKRFKIKKDACKIDAGLVLRDIEINHGYDQGEDRFRDFSPITTKSNLVIKHVWVLDGIYQSNDSTNINAERSPINILKLIWLHQRTQQQYRQHIKMRFPLAKQNYTFAHKLFMDTPLMSGWWLLKMELNHITCVEYDLFVSDQHSDQTTDNSGHELFNKHYNVSGICVGNSCHSQKWILSMRDELIAKLSTLNELFDHVLDL